ncbi:MAG: polysaccharide deacetylase family protein [Acidobacteriota bacterium]|nr:MAG: polysaccharide deacetylase family protein [Acidobacteriota bacterium]
MPASKPKAKKEKFFCITHPTRRARRRCYFCRRPLCPRCQFRLSGHIFCGALCHNRYQRWVRREHWRKTAARVAAHPAARWTAMGLALAVLAVTAYLSLTVLRSSELYAENELAAVPVMPELDVDDARWSLPGLIRLTEPADRSETTRSLVPVRGEAPAGAIVGLYLNGELLDAALAADGTFSFDEVPLPKDANTVQVRYYDRYGTSAYSNAALVFARGRTAQKPRPMRVAETPEEISRAANHIVRGSRAVRVVYLTFDGGSSANVAEETLRMLAQHRVRATMFLTGRFIERYPYIVRLIVQDGHEVGNHTDSHPHLTTFAANRRHQTLNGVSRAFLHDQLQKTSALFEEATGQEMQKMWRAPFGEHNHEIRRWAEELGYIHVGWTIDSLDWVAKRDSHLYAPMRSILERLLSFGEEARWGASGSIVLMHLGTERSPPERLPEILPDLIEGYRARGYRFGLASELLPRRRP